MSNWILTAHGCEVDMAYPRPPAITLRDVAHHLSLINRFTGATCRPYSVAEHSLLVLEILEREFRLPVAGLLAGLMHDAHEAYTGDMHTPGKRQVGEGWHYFEKRFERLVGNVFGLGVAQFDFGPQIKQADLLALATERAQLLPYSPSPWEALIHVVPLGWVDLMEPGRASLTWQDWRQAFTDRAESLMFARDLPSNGNCAAVAHHQV